jgi:hypothetical protein
MEPPDRDTRIIRRFWIFCIICWAMLAVSIVLGLHSKATYVDSTHPSASLPAIALFLIPFSGAVLASRFALQLIASKTATKDAKLRCGAAAFICLFLGRNLCFRLLEDLRISAGTSFQSSWREHKQKTHQGWAMVSPLSWAEKDRSAKADG